MKTKEAIIEQQKDFIPLQKTEPFIILTAFQSSRKIMQK